MYPLYIYICIILIFCVVFLLYSHVKFEYWKRRNVLYLRPNLFFGNVKDFIMKMGNMQFFKDLYDAYPNEKYYGSYFLHKPMLILKDPDMIRRVMITNFENFTDRVDFENDHDLLMRNLISFRGKKWNILRKHLSPIFTSNKLKNMLYLILEKAKNLEKHIENNELNAEYTNINRITSNYTLNIICSIGFGLSQESNIYKYSMFQKLSNSLFKANVLNFIRFGTRIGLTNFSNFFKIKIFSDKTETLYAKTIKDVVRRKLNTNENRHDFIDFILELRKKTIFTCNSDNDVNFSMDNEFITAQAFPFLSAGYEGPYSTISYILHELAHNTDIQEKVYREIVDVVDDSSEETLYETISNMPYIEAVIKESLRKYPIIPILPRMCSKSFQFPDTNLIIEKNQEIMIPIYGIHRDPKYYPDPEKFDPERFIGDASKNRHPMTHMGFSHGPRNCIGKRLALLMIKLGLVYILRGNKVEPCQKSVYPLEIHAPLLVTKPKNGIWLKIEKR